MTDLNTHMEDGSEEKLSQEQMHQLIEKKHKRLKKLELKKSVVSLWVVHRKLNRQGVAHYSALKVNAAEALRKKLRTAVISKIDKSNEVSPYEYVTGDLDDDMLEQPLETTDFAEVIGQVSRNGEEHLAEKQEQLMSAWGYVIKLQSEDTYVYAFRKLGQQWGSKKVSAGWALLFKDKVLMDLDDPAVFRTDAQIDFLSFEDSVFILNKKNFESAMNFREGMERHRDEIVKEFDELGIVTKSTIIQEAVGKNLHKLRRLASVKNSGYYRHPWYMEKVQTLNAQLNWGLNFDADGAIEVEEDNVDLILTLLNNDRLKSPITDEIFDVAVKKAVE